MIKKIKKLVNKNKYIIPALVISLAILVGGVVSVTAGNGLSFWDKVAQFTGSAIADRVDVPADSDEDMNLSGFPGPDIYDQVRFHGGILSETGIDIELNQPATSTPSTTTIVWGSYCHSGPELLVTDWYWEIETANKVWGIPDFAIGTTTIRSVGGFTATTTATMVASSGIATSTTGIFSLGGYSDDKYSNADNDLNTVTSTIGSFYADRQDTDFATTSPFVIQDGDCFVVNSSPGGATSTDSFELSYDRFVAKFHAEVVYR